MADKKPQGRLVPDHGSGPVTNALAGYVVTVSNGDPSDCYNCDGFGRVWNNADETSGQWVWCEICGDGK